jgi:hypothetical protein
MSLWLLNIISIVCLYIIICSAPEDKENEYTENEN